MESKVAKLFLKFLKFYLLNHMNTPYYFAIMDIKSELEEIVNKM